MHCENCLERRNFRTGEITYAHQLFGAAIVCPGHAEVVPLYMVQITNCRDVCVEGIRMTNPAGWTLHLQDSERAIVRNVTIDNDLRTPNSDGIDVTGCRDVRISDCYISTCDDGIVLKSDSGPVERVTVTNCVIRTMCAALKLGTNGTHHDIRQVAFSNCSIFQSHRGVAIYTVEGDDNC